MSLIGVASSTGKHSLKSKRQLLRVYQIQVAILFVLSLCLYAIHPITGYSVFFGGLIQIVPTIIFARKALKHDKKMSAGQVLGQMYAGQIWKMALSAVMFALVFVSVKPISPFSLFVSFIGMQLLGWYLHVALNKRFLKLK